MCSQVGVTPAPYVAPSLTNDYKSSGIRKGQGLYSFVWNSEDTLFG